MNLRGRSKFDRRENDICSVPDQEITYAIGRKLNSGDRDTVDSIVAEMTRSGKGLRDLIKMIVLSETFLTN